MKEHIERAIEKPAGRDVHNQPDQLVHVAWSSAHCCVTIRFSLWITSSCQQVVHNSAGTSPNATLTPEGMTVFEVTELFAGEDTARECVSSVKLATGIGLS